MSVCVYSNRAKRSESRSSHRLVSLCLSETEMGRRALLIFEKNDDRAAFVSSERARPWRQTAKMKLSCNKNSRRVHSVGWNKKCEISRKVVVAVFAACRLGWSEWNTTPSLPFAILSRWASSREWSWSLWCKQQSQIWHTFRTLRIWNIEWRIMIWRYSAFIAWSKFIL